MQENEIGIKFFLYFFQIQEELNCEKPSLRLLYVTPELVVTPGFNAKLCKLHCRGLLSLIAVDEVRTFYGLLFDGFSDYPYPLFHILGRFTGSLHFVLGSRL